ncbi:hypothetical protein, partial [Bradyrhizobium niftali]|uniref:hypothetical protein n=1 Tax=Bradyrhizobium niftali TaxID=2560055 RepID=UPI001ADDB309
SLLRVNEPIWDMVDLLCCVQARDHRGLVAIESSGTADPHRQAAAHAEDGVRRSCCCARSGAAAGKKIDARCCGEQAGSQTASRGRSAHNKARRSQGITARLENHPEEVGRPLSR